MKAAAPLPTWKQATTPSPRPLRLTQEHFFSDLTTVKRNVTEVRFVPASAITVRLAPVQGERQEVSPAPDASRLPLVLPAAATQSRPPAPRLAF